MPEREGQNIIAVRQLTHAYRKGVPVLQGVDLTVAPGEIVGLIGLSGAGKSTLLRCLNGLITPTGGTCEVLGNPVPQLSERDRRRLRRRIGMIFQEFNLVDRFSVLKNVLIGRLAYAPALASCLGRFSRADVALARDCLAQVGLAGLEARRVRDLSGGQKQRVAIARALAQGAQIILADEATANLDVLTKDDIMDLLQGIVREKGTTLVLSMHDLPLARRYCTRIVGLKHGRITFDADPDALSDAAVADVLERVPQ
ncbi:MAG: phosphonate ABC transporter ATP-binding protein [Armatimonadetes bacterium]|nr:phosphonate ABC transporter ATP-binding protein [Armatimonadota bacterium]